MNGKSLILLALLAGCAGDRDMGLVTERNVEAQVVDMHPQYAGVPIEGSSGVRSAAAISRYKAGAVKPLTASASAAPASLAGSVSSTAK